jgi:capsular exopolysaccharide synthesis family protein
MFDVLAEKRAQVLLTGTPGGNTYAILKPASISFAPSGPATWQWLITAMIAGLLISLPFASWAENRTQQRIRNRETLDQLTKIPFIGTISTNSVTAKETDNSISNLCTAVLLKPDAKLITFTASESNTGKDFIALRFAQSLAAMDKKVLIMDMDPVSNPVTGLLDANPEHNLSDVLKGTCDVHDAVCLTSYPNLDLLQGGEFQDGINSLLVSKHRTKIYEDLKKHYDIIVTVTPDIGTQIDAVPLMKLGDLSLFVVRTNTTRKKSLVRAEQIKKDYSIENLCLLLNTVSSSTGTRGVTSGKTKVRNINSSTGSGKTSYVPGMLRKISLWFY